MGTLERLHFHFSLSGIGEGNGNPLQCSCLENSRDGRAWWAAVYGVAQSQTRLKQLSSSSSSSSSSNHLQKPGFSRTVVLRIKTKFILPALAQCKPNRKDPRFLDYVYGLFISGFVKKIKLYHISVIENVNHVILDFPTFKQKTYFM